MKLKALIVDDESLARSLVKKYCIDSGIVEVAGEARNGMEALSLINELQPDVVFLDIQMPGISGLELLELLETPPFIIFVTAFDEFAVKAFEKNAVDYLMKPVEYERFIDAVNKLISRIAVKNINSEYAASLENLRKDTAPFISTISVKDKGDFVIIKVEDILFFEAMDDYVAIHTKNKKFLKKGTLRNLEEKLDGKIFSRIHRSIILNLSFLDKVLNDGNENYRVILKNGSELPVSRTGFKNLKTIIS